MKIFPFLIAVQLLSYTLFPLELYADDSKSLSFGAFPLPPLINASSRLIDDPYEEKTDRPGISDEIHKKVFQILGIKSQIKRYPPSRLFKMIQNEKIEAFALAHSFAVKHEKSYYCLTEFQSMNVYLYQNLETSKELKNIEKELIGKRIWVPKESLGFFSSLIPKDNELYGLVQPLNLAKAFAFGRAPYMIDYMERAEHQLSKNPPAFRYIRYPLIVTTIDICIRKNIPNSKQLLHKIYDTWMEVDKTDYAKSIYEKYGFVPTWGGK